MEVGSGDFFRESACVGDVFEKFSVWHQFHDNGNNFVSLVILLDIVDGLIEFNKIDDVRVLELRQNFHFLADSLQVQAWVAVLDGLDSDLLFGSGMNSQLDPRKIFMQNDASLLRIISSA